MSGKTVTVAVGDKLTLTGKGTGVSPLNTGNILATGSTGSLTFTGGTLDVTDLTEYPKVTIQFMLIAAPVSCLTMQ